MTREQIDWYQDRLKNISDRLGNELSSYDIRDVLPIWVFKHRATIAHALRAAANNEDHTYHMLRDDAREAIDSMPKELR